MTDILIRDAMILTLDAEDRLIERGDILVRDGAIAAVGAVPPLEPGPGEAVRVIDGRNRLAVPGLVNAHMHSQSATLAGFADAVSHPAFMWLTQAHTARRTPDEIRLWVQLSALQMLTTGTTAAIDHFPGQRFTADDLDAVAAAWDETGMRAVLAMRFYDGTFGDILPDPAVVGADLAKAAEAILAPQPLAELEELMPDAVRRWHGRSGRLTLAPAPSNPDRCSDAALVFCADLAATHDLPIHTHLLETRRQAMIARERTGVTTVRHLADLGVLSDRWSCAHSIWLDDADIALMAETGAIAVHNPESNARIGAGTMRTPDMLAAGVRIALGTDGAGANDNLGMHEAMRAAAVLHRAALPDRRRWVTARDALRMATVGGAAAFRQTGRIGAIAPGYRADIVLYRLDHPSWTPVNDPVAHLVFAETGSAVDTVLVDGRVLVEDGRVRCFDTKLLYEEIRSSAAKLLRRNDDLFKIAQSIAAASP